MTVLAIDQGTSGTKAIVVDPEDGVIGLAEIDVHPRYAEGGGVEVDPAELLRSVVDAGNAAVAQAGRPIDAVALANQGETVLAWDRETGRPLTPAIVWQDRRVRGRFAKNSVRTQAIWLQRTGLILDPYFSAPKMTWLRRNLETGGVVTTSDTWLLHQLCGEFITDATTASRSLLVELGAPAGATNCSRSSDWTTSRCRESRETTRSSDRRRHSAVTCRSAASSSISRLRCSPRRASSRAPRSAPSARGRSSWPTRARRRWPRRSGLTTSVAWRVGGADTYCIDGQVYTAASAIRWLESLGIISGADELDSVATADAGGVMCVPALAGLAAPWWRPQATAVMSGMTLSTGRGHVVLAVLQGIAAQIAELVTAVENDTGQAPSRMRVDGGLTRSRVLMQATADIVGVPVDVYPSPHATALGAAALARLEPAARASACATWSLRGRRSTPTSRAGTRPGPPNSVLPGAISRRRRNGRASR